MRNNFIAAVMLATVMVNASGASASSPGNGLAAAQVVFEAPKLAISQSIKILIEELKAEGFRYIEVKRTFLGRARIIAISAFETREIILNPTTGEVLRDLARNNQEEVPDGDTGSVENSNAHGNNPNSQESNPNAQGNNPGVQGNNKGGLGNGGNSGGGGRN
jgi:hypothetical protein